MELHATFKEYRGRRLWCCYPLIWEANHHNGFGGYAKPPINPHTLKYASTDNAETLGTYEEALARVGEMINLNGERVRLEGVGLSLTLSGLFALDLDSVARLTPDTPGQKGRATREALEIVQHFGSYAEVSPSGDGIHIFFKGTLPADLQIKKVQGKRDIKGGTAAEYQLMTSGYMTITGQIVGAYDTINERTEQLAEFCAKYLVKAQGAEKRPAADPKAEGRPAPKSTRSGFYSWDRWKAEAEGLTDQELLERIYTSPRMGPRVRELYNGDISNYPRTNKDGTPSQSEADAALMTYLYGFTHDEAQTVRLFCASALYRGKGANSKKRKSAKYYETTLKAAINRAGYYIGTIKAEPSAEDRKAYAQEKEAEETARARARAEKRQGYSIRPQASDGSGDENRQ